MKNIIVWVCIGVLAVSCHDDDSFSNVGEKLRAIYFDVEKFYEYEYDNMKNPYHNMIPDRIPGESTNPNNVMRRKYVVHDYPDASSDIRYTYQYNSRGYPTERNDGQRYKY